MPVRVQKRLRAISPSTIQHAADHDLIRTTRLENGITVAERPYCRAWYA